MRTRSRTTGTFEPRTVRRQRTRACSGNWSSWANLYTHTGGTVITKSITDVVTPGFTALVKCGDFLPLNPVQISTLTETRNPFNCPQYRQLRTCSPLRNTWETTGDVWWTEDVSRFEVPEAVLTSTLNAAVARARSGTWDALTDAAEIRSTYRLLLSTAKSVWRIAGMVMDDAVRIAKSRKRRGISFQSQVREIFGQKWLEYRYGWMPLILSLQDAIKALDHQIKVGDLVKGRAYTLLEGSNSDVISLVTSDYVRSTTVHHEWRVQVRGWSAAEMKFQSAVQLDPLKTAWEVVSFSFVVDWFIQVGSWLEAISPFASGVTLGSQLSIQTNETIRLSGELTFIDNSNSFGQGNGSEVNMHVLTWHDYQRYAATPSLPGWNPRLNWKRNLDALALISALNRDLFRKIRI